MEKPLSLTINGVSKQFTVSCVFLYLHSHSFPLLHFDLKMLAIERMPVRKSFNCSFRLKIALLLTELARVLRKSKEGMSIEFKSMDCFYCIIFIFEFILKT